jgi:Tfp pilus assembly protein PilZ
MGEDIRVGAVPMERTQAIGNTHSGRMFDVAGQDPVRWIQVCWDDNAVKGIAFKFHGEAEDEQHTFGDWSDRETLQTSSLQISAQDPLRSFSASTSLDYESVSGIKLQTQAMHSQGDDAWTIGNLTDAPSCLQVAGRSLMGFFGYVGADNCISGIGLWVTPGRA